MPKAGTTKQDIVDAIRRVAQALGHPPSRAKFIEKSGITEYSWLQYFPSWREAVRAAGLEPDSTNVRLDDSVLLEDWSELVRKHRHIPTRHQYRREGKYSAGAFDKYFGPWSAIPSKFREFAQNKQEWIDVLALLPVYSHKRETGSGSATKEDRSLEGISQVSVSQHRHTRLDNRPTYGNPLDFRGLRHEPVNEDGVVFLFGMVARELGYLVEAVQAGFPDCEAKRQIGAGKWQRVRIEFEFESRNFRDHGHPSDGCDIIVCWRHNWTECPENLEVVDLSSMIRSLAKSED